jgi:hypothetical protein
MGEFDPKKLDKTAFSVGSLLDESDEKQYWLNQTPAERLAAIEQIRILIYGYHPSTARLQRVLEVAEFKTN